MEYSASWSKNEGLPRGLRGALSTISRIFVADGGRASRPSAGRLPRGGHARPPPPDLLFQPFSDQPRRSRGRGRPRRRAPATRTAAGQKDFFDTFLPRLFRAPPGRAVASPSFLDLGEGERCPAERKNITIMHIDSLLRAPSMHSACPIRILGCYTAIRFSCAAFLGCALLQSLQ